MNLATLKAQTDIVTIIGNHITLSEKGGKLWACCPFHDEDTPSFQVDTESQRFYCYGCHEKGDAFDFLMMFHNCGLMEAVRMIAPKDARGRPQAVKVRRKPPDLWKRIALWKDLHFGALNKDYQHEILDWALKWIEANPCYDPRTPIVMVYLQWRFRAVRSSRMLNRYRWKVWIWSERVKAIKRILTHDREV